MATTRIRSLKPDYFGSPDTAKASWKARVLFPALWCWADDWGYGVTNVKAINAFAFEHDDLPDSEVVELLREIAGTFGVVFYTHGGRCYFKIPSWDDHQKTQRRSKKRLPEPNDPESSLDLRFHDTHGTSAHSQGNSEGTQGNVPSGKGIGMGKGRGTGEDGFASEPDDDEPDHLPATIERDDVNRLCEHLERRIIDNGCRKPKVNKPWRDAARLLLDKDNVNEADAHRLIDWCQDHHFWKSNILSFPKFREQYDRLRIQAEQTSRSTSSFGRPSMSDAVGLTVDRGNRLIAAATAQQHALRDESLTLALETPQTSIERPF